MADIAKMIRALPEYDSGELFVPREYASQWGVPPNAISATVSWLVERGELRRHNNRVYKPRKHWINGMRLARSIDDS